MSRQVTDLETVLQMLIDEHKRLLAHVQIQQAAMGKMELDKMEDASHRAEACRMRIATLDTRRRLLVAQIAKLSRVDPASLTIPQIAAAFPQNGPRLIQLRNELKTLMQQLADRTYVAGRLAAAVLGHLNTAMRLFAGAVGQAGTYTKNGVPRVANRIGVMEAVG